MTSAIPPVDSGFGPLIGLRMTGRDMNSSECELEVTPALLNPHGTVHGGAVYSMADQGMGAALYPHLVDGELCATIEITIAYFVAVRSGRLVCRSRVINKAKRVATLESEIRQGDTLVAKALGTFAIFAGSIAERR
ncbi:MAG TPA: PaaI family thioesterase [Tepidiformaceae bacterium]